MDKDINTYNERRHVDTSLSLFLSVDLSLSHLVIQSKWLSRWLR
jgi:hypothetical protein